MINAYIKQLVRYGLDNGLISKEDVIYTTNMLLLHLKLDSYEDEENTDIIDSPAKLEAVLNGICDYAYEMGIIKDNSIVSRDLFDTEIMNLLLERPSRIIDSFWDKYKISPEKATDYFYGLSKASNYIREYRIMRDKKWIVPTEYGDLDITINLSKPEKDPKMIELAGKMKSSDYPKCQLCMENEGYAGRINHPARENHRIIPIEINNGKWGFQYSPYVYYNEHCIVFNGKHVPMGINRDTFVKMFDFIKQFPHYFVGSNADLPIVGGSILSHDHFQGGRYTFAMEKAGIEKDICFSDYGDVRAGIVRWPMSVIRLNAPQPERIIDLADRILSAWRKYTDEAAQIYAYTEGVPHNTITPIARRRDGNYELDLVLRNNITTDERPLGLYHPSSDLWHIKKENIGLIEVMGLAVLPARLKSDLERIADILVTGGNIDDYADLSNHANWVKSIIRQYADINKDNAEDILKKETGRVFLEVLKCAGVYKRNNEGQAAFMRFIEFADKIL